MRKETATIFNNVMGPITAGPSTSNTCGPGRIAYLSRCALGEPPKSVRVIFPADSAFPCTYQGMKTDYAIANGILGRLPDDPDFPHALEHLQEQGISLTFEISHVHHAILPLTTYLILTAENGETVEITGVSKGGGIIELLSVNGFHVQIGGESDVLFAFLDTAAATGLGDVLKAKFSCKCEIATKGGKALAICTLGRRGDADSILREVKALPHVERARYLPAVLPVVALIDAQPPFTTAGELMEYCAREGKALWEAAVDYESAVSGWSAAEVMAAMGHVLDAARQSMTKGLCPNVQYCGILPAKAEKMQKNLQSGGGLPGGIVSKAGIYAAAIMECSNASGVVVCIPTAGASGVVSGLMLAAGEALDIPDEELIKAYLCAGAVGVVCTEENDFCGAQYGCQAEVGFASAFAAAGYGYLLGCGPEESLAAASMALQNMLGLVCDPVCGFVQIPCYARNMSGIANAVASAEAVRLGFDPAIPLEEVFETVKKIGALLPRELRGCGGGLCWTPTAKALAGRLRGEN